MKNLSFILFVMLFCTCCNRPDAKKTLLSSGNPDKFFVIDYENSLDNKMMVGLSQLASNIEYIRLETNNDCMLRNRVKYFFTDSLIFVNNINQILKFSRDGKFLKKIGKRGRGPGELDLIMNMSIVPDKSLIVVQKNSERKLLYFSFDGEMVKSVNIPYIERVKVMNDGRYIAYESGNGGSEKYTFRLTNEYGDTISFVNNYTTWVNTSSGDGTRMMISISYPSFETFYFYGNRFYFKAMYNDTVYYISSNKIEPGYFINLGKFKLPQELRPERLGHAQINRFNEASSDYYFANAFEASDKIFLASFCYGKSQPKYILFDKKKHLGNFLINNGSESTGFVNDWDGGMDFWPIGNISDDKVYMPVNILDFQKYFKEQPGQKSVKFPEKQKQLEKLISGLDISNNPIIMVVTLK